MSGVRQYAGELIVALLALMLLGVGLGEVPGLHHDEAWVIETAAQMTNGARPLTGMNHYSGVFHVYLLWPVMELWGDGVQVVRAAGALCGVLFVLLSMLLWRRLFGSRDGALWAGMLLVSSPAFVAFFRFGVELTTVVPVLLFGGLVLLSRAHQACPPQPLDSPLAGRARQLRAVAAGVLWGLAGYTHIIALSFPLAAGLAAVAVSRGRALRQRAVWLTGLGLALGFAPRLLLLASSDQVLPGPHLAAGLSELLLGLRYLPVLLSGLWDGELVYQRFAGGNLLVVLPLASAALLLLILGRGLLLRRTPPAPAELWLWLFLLLHGLALLLITPALSLRYYALLVQLLPLAVVALAAPLMAHGRWPRRLVQLLLGLMICANGAYLAANYFYAFAIRGGTPAVFSLGQRLTETSNHFVRTDLLYRQLRQRRVKLVLGTHFIIAPLRIHDRSRSLLFDEFLPGDPIPRLPAPLSGRVALLFYAGPMVNDGKSLDMRTRRIIRSRGRSFSRDPGFTRNFLVYIHEPN